MNTRYVPPVAIAGGLSVCDHNEIANRVKSISVGLGRPDVESNVKRELDKPGSMIGEKFSSLPTELRMLYFTVFYPTGGITTFNYRHEMMTYVMHNHLGIPSPKDHKSEFISDKLFKNWFVFASISLNDDRPSLRALQYKALEPHQYISFMEVLIRYAPLNAKGLRFVLNALKTLILTTKLLQDANVENEYTLAAQNAPDISNPKSLASLLVESQTPMYKRFAIIQEEFQNSVLFDVLQEAYYWLFVNSPSLSREELLSRENALLWLTFSNYAAALKHFMSMASTPGSLLGGEMDEHKVEEHLHFLKTHYNVE